MHGSPARGEPSPGRTSSRRGRGGAILASLAAALLLAVALAPAASAAEADASAVPAAPTLWDYRTIFVVWDEAAFDWRADWNDGPATLGLEAVLDAEGSVGWELDTIAPESYDLIARDGTTNQEARRLRLIFRRPLDTSTVADPSDAAVSIQGFSFQPEELSVAVGTTVTWTNADPTAHTVSAADGTFDSGQMAPETTFSQAFDTAGTFTYICAIHPTMTGTIVVS